MERTDFLSEGVVAEKECTRKLLAAAGRPQSVYLSTDSLEDPIGARFFQKFSHNS